jgi:hypothetical protein
MFALPVCKAICLCMVGCRHSVVDWTAWLQRLTAQIYVGGPSARLFGWSESVVKWTAWLQTPLELCTLVCEHFSSAAKFGEHLLQKRSCGGGCCFVMIWYHHQLTLTWSYLPWPCLLVTLSWSGTTTSYFDMYSTAITRYLLPVE